MNRNRKKLAVYGDLNMDIQLKTADRPAPGQDARVEQVAFEAGGSAANCAAAAARLGLDVTFLGAAGTDPFASRLLQDLAELGVSTQFVKRAAGNSGMVLVLVDPGGERTFYSYRGVNASTRIDNLPSGFFETYACLHLSGYSYQDEASRHSAEALLESARGSGAAVTLDASFWFAKEYLPTHPNLLAELDVLLLNQEEAQLICGQAEPQAAAGILRQAGPRIVLVKCGAQGCFLAGPAGVAHIPAFTGGLVIDTTGAGDTFCAGFLAGQMWGLEDAEAASLGNAAAACVIRSLGGHRGSPDLPELLKFLRDHQAGGLAATIKNRLGRDG